MESGRKIIPPFPHVRSRLSDVLANVGIIAEKACAIICIGPSELHAYRYNIWHVLQIGSFFIEVPPIEPKKAMVNPNFRTPPR